MRSSLSVLGFLVCSLPGAAFAHFTLTAPPPTTTSTDGGKGGAPCGPDASSSVITSVTGGQKLKVSVNETTPHTGFYRIALSIDSRSQLPIDNVVRDSMGKAITTGDSVSADFEATPVFPVLADNQWKHNGTAVMSFETQVTLPNVNCARCTLQVIEFMQGHPAPYFYHHCADLKITADPSKPLFTPGSGGAGGASSGGASGASGAAGSGGSSGSNFGGSSGSNFGGSGGETTGSAGTSGAVAVGGSDVGGSAGQAGGAIAGTSAGGPSVAGASSGSPSAAGASAAGAPGTPAADGDSGGCSFAPHGASTAGLVTGLLGLLIVKRRRRARIPA